MIDISIVILTYNQWDLTRQTIESISEVKKGSNLNIQTIISDNGSTEPIVEEVKVRFPWIDIVDNKANLGFSAGNNRGVEIASGKYVLFLNSDTKVFTGVIEYLINILEKQNSIGIATCRVELEDGSLDPASHRGFPTPWRALTYYSGLEKLSVKLINEFGKNNFTNLIGHLFGGYHLVYKDMKIPHEIDACTGAFLLMTRELGESLGWWDEQFFMYGEDLDLCYRVKEKKLKVMYYPDVKIIHYKHSSGLKIKADLTSSDEEKRKRIQTKYKTTNAFYDAMKLFYKKHYSNVYPRIVQYLVFFGIDYKKNKALSRLSKL